jgi:hypothetical protein
MARSARDVLLDKNVVPDDGDMERILGAHLPRWRELIVDLRKRELPLEMRWRSDKSGWAPCWPIGDYTVCSALLSDHGQAPIGFISFGPTLFAFLEREWSKVDGFVARGLSTSARASLRAALPDGEPPMRFLEVTLIARADVDVFLSLVDGKLRALAAEGMRPVPRPDIVRRRATRPAAETVPMLVIAQPGGPIHFVLDRAEYVIGRDDDVDIRLDHPDVSRKHAKLVRLVDGSFELIDLGSKNGVSLNQQKIDRRLLKDDDEFVVGDTRFMFSSRFTLPGR